MTVFARHYTTLLRWLPLLEGLILFAAVYFGVSLRIGFEAAALAGHEIDSIAPDAAVFTGVMLLCMTATGLYNKRLRDRLEGVVIRLVMAMASGVLLLGALYYLFLDLFLGRGVLILAVLSAFAALVFGRALLGRQREKPVHLRRVLVLGSGTNAAAVSSLKRRTDLIGVHVVGFVPIPGDETAVSAERQIRLPESLPDWVVDNDVDEVVVAPDERRQTLDMNALVSCRANGTMVTDVNTFIERETGCLAINDMTPGWFAYGAPVRSPLVSERVKRFFDIAIALAGVVVTAPLTLAAAAAILIEDGPRAPILYRQQRVGLNGKTFSVYKFRSMRTDAEKPGEARWAAANDPRVTRVGRVLRRLRIDELPQLFNVLRGDMSFVGPRPERPEFVRELEKTFPHYADRHRVKPGLSGWAQVRYTYGASEEDAFQKLRYDLFYLKNRNLYLDLVILLLTAEVVLWGRGVR